MTESTFKNEEAARTLRALLRDVIEQGALEVHFEWHPELQRTLCLVRVDGELRKHAELPAGIHSQLVEQVRRLGGNLTLQRREPSHVFVRPVLGDERAGRGEPLGLTFLPMVNGEEDVVIERLVDWSPSMFPLSAALSDRACVEFLCSASSGTVLFAGGVGSGHTTLARAYLGDLAGRNLKIISLSRDDGPPTTWMREMERKDGADVMSATRAAMAAYPDVVYLGRIDSAAHVAATTLLSRDGHGAVATIRARTLIDSLINYLEYGIEVLRARTVAHSLDVILYSQLVQRLCKDCRRADATLREAEFRKQAMATNDVHEKALEALIERFRQDAGRVRTWHAQGCDKCAGTGYRGRIAVIELLRVTPAIRELLCKDSGYSELANVLRNERFRTFAEDGLRHVLEGDLSLEQWRSVSDRYRAL
jgi:type II secretory ATPase GspE/PulE/Tfp pilus assembly ATPase PilB-like protein